MEEYGMKTVTLEVSSREKTNQRFLRAMNGEEQGAFISFETPELLFKVISGKRWELLRMMTGADAMTIREAARRVGRDVKAVHGDIQILLKAGILKKTEREQIIFPYQVVHVDFLLTAAA